MEPQDNGIRFCRECGNAIPRDSDFCYACGALAPASPAIRIVRSDGPAAGQETPSDSSLQGSDSVPPNGQETFTQTGGEAVFTIPPEVLRSYTMTLARIAKSVSNMVSIWAVIALIFGTISLVSAPAMVQMLNEFYGTVVDIDTIYHESSFLLFSGLTALIAAVLLRKLRMMHVCIICLVISAFASYPGVGGFLGLVTCMAGLYMALAAYRCRRVFH